MPLIYADSFDFVFVNAAFTALTGYSFEEACGVWRMMTDQLLPRTPAAPLTVVPPSDVPPSDVPPTDVPSS